MDYPVNRTRMLAKELLALRSSDLSDADLRQLEVLVFDQISVALYGATTPWGAAVRAYAERMDGTGRAPVVASAAKTVALAKAREPSTVTGPVIPITG